MTKDTLKVTTLSEHKSDSQTMVDWHVKATSLMNQNLFFCDFIVKKLESQLNYFQLCCVSEQQRWAAKKATRKCLYTFCQLFALRLRVTFVFRALSPELLALTLVLLEPGNYSTYFAKKKVKNFLFYFFRNYTGKIWHPCPVSGKGVRQNIFMKIWFFREDIR